MNLKKTKITGIGIVCCFFSLTGCGPQQKEPVVAETHEVVSAVPPEKEAPPPPVSDSTLIGDWVRTDADYRIAIEKFNEDGTVIAKYFNPKSIHVGKALWRQTDGSLQVYIELQDVNYPGSNYTLRYIPEYGLLAGQYYQAVDKETYDVGFTRFKK